MRIRSDRLTWREIDGDVVALDLETSTYFSANKTASVILRALADGAEEDDLVAAIGSAFTVDDDRARADVRSFVMSLRDMGLLED